MIKNKRQILNDLNLNIKVIGVKKDNRHSPDAIVDGDTYQIINIDKGERNKKVAEGFDEELFRSG